MAILDASKPNAEAMVPASRVQTGRQGSFCINRSCPSKARQRIARTRGGVVIEVGNYANIRIYGVVQEVHILCREGIERGRTK